MKDQRKTDIICVIIGVVVAIGLFTIEAWAEEGPPTPKIKEVEVSTAWCEAHGGIAEYRLADKSRVDCWIPHLNIAAEHDWATNHTYECVQQAKWYGLNLAATPLCIIMRKPGQADADMERYGRRATDPGNVRVLCIDDVVNAPTITSECHWDKFGELIGGAP